MPKQIFAIYDNVAEAIIGGLHLHSHSAAAVRMFGDVAAMRDSQIGLHPADFDLILVGTLNDDASITPFKSTIITGAAWAAAQTSPPAGELQIA